MLQRIKNIHPGWFISGFFVILIAFNVVFFIIAASDPVRLVPTGPAAPAAAPVSDVPASDGVVPALGDASAPAAGAVTAPR